MSDKYILDGHTPVPCEDLYEWGAWMETADRTVKKTNLGDVLDVSTVFLGLDHSHGFGPPLLFETMVFRYPDVGHDLEMERYTTWDEAVAGHDAIVRRLRAQERETR